jgi:outer membrane protein OmpA-like peptidoglycan-associated protein
MGWIWACSEVVYAQTPAAVRWADTLLMATSQHSFPEFGIAQLLGPPNVAPQTGFHPCAWAPADEHSLYEFVAVGFRNPAPAQQVIVCETHKPGAIVRITLLLGNGQRQVVYAGKPPAAEVLAMPGRIFSVNFARTQADVLGVEVILDISWREGLVQLDAIGLRDDTVPFAPTIHQVPDGAKPRVVENLGPNINTPLPEIVPIISPDGQTLYFDRKFDTNNAGGTDDPDDIWVSTLGSDGVTWQPARNIGHPLNNAGNNAVCGITADGNTLLLASRYVGHTTEGGMSLSQRTTTGWSAAVAVDIPNFYTLGDYVFYHLSADGQTILMSLKREGGFGDLDLYVSHRQPDGRWSAPLSLGPDINTAAEEASPFLAADGQTLYFSSGGFPGYGSNDIFVTKRLDDTWQSWSRPLNLGPSINTPLWDGNFSTSADGRYGYFVSQHNSLGETDIFRVPLAEDAKPGAVVLLSGQALDGQNRKPLAGVQIDYVDLQGGQVLGATRSGLDGMYQITLPAGKQYRLAAQADGYIAESEFLDLRELSQYAEMARDLLLAPLKAGQRVRLNNLFFDTDKATLQPQSRTELNRLADMLRLTPGMRIEIAGHTDNTGLPKYNADLSQRRAQAVADYLVTQHQIDGSRLVPRGYGATQLLTKGTDPVSRALNRRVEIQILSVE